MSAVVAALAPVFGLIVVGYLLRARGIFGDGFWAVAERLTFYVLFPALLVTSIGGADLGGLVLLPMAAALVTATLLTAGLMLALKSRLEAHGVIGPGFVSVLQGAIRPNTYIGIAAAFALYGAAGLPLVAVAIVAVIPLVNFLGIVAHLRWAAAAPGDAAARPGWGEAVAAALRNPIIVACLLGAAINLLGIGLPPVVGPMLEILGRGALPLGLMAVGAGLDSSALGRARGPIVLAAAARLLVAPVLAYLACRAFGVGGATAAVAVLFMALPVSAASYVMSRQLGGDSPLMAGIVTATTVAAALTLPMWVAVAG